MKGKHLSVMPAAVEQVFPTLLSLLIVLCLYYSRYSTVTWYGDGVASITEESTVISLMTQMQSARDAGSKTVLQWNRPVLNWGCWLTVWWLWNNFVALYLLNLPLFSRSITRTFVSEGHWRISTHADPTCNERHISSVTFKSAHLYNDVYMRVGMARALANSFNFGLLGEREQSSQKCMILCLGCRCGITVFTAGVWNAEQNLMSLALSSVEKSISVQTNKHTNSKRYIHTLPVGMCG